MHRDILKYNVSGKTSKGVLSLLSLCDVPVLIENARNNQTFPFFPHGHVINWIACCISFMKYQSLPGIEILCCCLCHLRTVFQCLHRTCITVEDWRLMSEIYSDSDISIRCNCLEQHQTLNVSYLFMPVEKKKINKHKEGLRNPGHTN